MIDPANLLPIPGGPDRRAAFQGPLGADDVFFCAAGLLNCFSHVANPVKIKEKEFSIYLVS